MTAVETIRGPIDSDRLGRVLVHEHVFTGNIEHLLNYGRDFDEAAEIGKAADKLNALKASGIDTIIDLTVLGLGRFIPRIQQVAALTDLNIIAATGCYTLNELPMQFASVGPGLMFDEPDPMPDLFVEDLVSGIADTGVKAAVLKCAIDEPGLTPGVERVMRAVAQAHRRTGAPITVHTAAHTRSGLVAQQVFAEEGVDLRDVIIGHSGDCEDLDYLMALADRGSILGMDRFGIGIALSLEKRVATIARLISCGYLSQIALSHDCYCHTNFHPGGVARFHQHDYLTVSHHVLPALRAAGIGNDKIDAMLCENPRRHFEGAAKRFALRAAATNASDGVP